MCNANKQWVCRKQSWLPLKIKKLFSRNYSKICSILCIKFNFELVSEHTISPLKTSVNICRNNICIVYEKHGPTLVSLQMKRKRISYISKASTRIYQSDLDYISCHIEEPQDLEKLIAQSLGSKTLSFARVSKS